MFLFLQSPSNDLGRIFADNARVFDVLYQSAGLVAVSLAVVCRYSVTTAGNSWKFGA